VMAFSFLYDVYGISVKAKDVVKCAVMFIGCCLALWMKLIFEFLGRAV